ncbi:MAG: DMT family transporter [Acidimicrobiia bacterium]
MTKRFLPEIALLVATVFYGATFTIVQDALEDVTPTGFILVRFSIAAVVLAPFALARGWKGPAPRPTDSSRMLVLVGGAIGFSAFIGYVCQNVGLQHTSTSNSAFITGLFAVFTPIVQVLVYRKWPAPSVLLAVVIAVIGLYFLTGADLTLNRGDAITLGTAAAFGVWFVQIGRAANRYDTLALTTVQLAFLALFAVPAVAIEGMGELTGRALMAAAVTAVGASAIAFSLQVWAQRTIEPARASVIGLFELVVAGFVGYAVGERLGWAGYLGAGVILAAILVAESGTWRRAVAAAQNDQARYSTPGSAQTIS